MKRKDYLKQIRGLNDADIAGEALKLSEERLKLRFRMVTGQLSETHNIKRARKNMARVMTEINTRRKSS